jgi:hypothetical protein
MSIYSTQAPSLYSSPNLSQPSLARQELMNRDRIYGDAALRPGAFLRRTILAANL